jgi:hypothetical protein
VRNDWHGVLMDVAGYVTAHSLQSVLLPFLLTYRYVPSSVTGARAIRLNTRKYTFKSRPTCTRTVGYGTYVYQRQEEAPEQFATTASSRSARRET